MVDDSKLLFIISQPRAGSTLLQGVTSNNPYVATTSEPWLLLPFVGLYQPSLITARYNQEWMMYALDDFAGKLGGKVWFQEKLREFLMNIYSCLAGPDTKYILDKTPRYYQIAELLPQFFPDAKIIVLKRDPHAVVNSILRSWNVRSIKQLSLYSEDILKAPYSIQKFVESNKSNNILEIHYENMVSQPEDTFRLIYNWLKLPFDPDSLRYGENKKFRGIFGDQVGVAQSDRPFAQSLDSWKSLLAVPFWGNWLRGYSAYLGHETLRAYGNYDCISNQITGEFRYFQFISSNRKAKMWLVLPQLKRIVRFLSHRMRYGLPSREWSINRHDGF